VKSEFAPRQPVKTYLPLALRKRLREYAAKKGVSESSVNHAALSRYLDERNDGPLILRRLDRIERNQYREQQNNDAFAEAFAVFVKIWFAHTPRIAASERPSAEQSALHRFREYVDHAAEKFAEGESFVADLVRADLSADSDEAAPVPTAPGASGNSR
jgi:hypothetical protein